MLKICCVIDVFTKNPCAKTLHDKKAKTFLNGFIRIVTKSKRNPNKLWVDQWKEFCNSIMEKMSHDNDIFMHSTHDEDNLVVQ